MPPNLWTLKMFLRLSNSARPLYTFCFGPNNTFCKMDINFQVWNTLVPGDIFANFALVPQDICLSPIYGWRCRQSVNEDPNNQTAVNNMSNTTPSSESSKTTSELENIVWHKFVITFKNKTSNRRRPSKTHSFLILGWNHARIGMHTLLQSHWSKQTKVLRYERYLFIFIMYYKIFNTLILFSNYYFIHTLALP